MIHLKPLILILLITSAFSKNIINYTEPAPDAKYVSVKNNIIIGFENSVNIKVSDIQNCISVTGSKSGLHSGTVKICNDAKKLIFTPQSEFEYGEKVTVKLAWEKIKNGFPGKGNYEFSFYTSSQKVYVDKLKNTMDINGPVPGFENHNEVFPIPQLTVTINNNPSEGSIFLASLSIPAFLIITDKNGIPYWSYQNSASMYDFKKQLNGHLTYFSEADKKHYELDQYYNIVDTYYCGNGYQTDPHELIVLNNRHALVMAYDPQTVNMSEIIHGGNPNATVVGLIIQEIDESKNVVFQWRSWDHFQITDAVRLNLLDAYIDYVHGNAIEVDSDGNLLICSRHLEEITKINRTTGSIIWRFGGGRNQFTFTNDTIGFSFQHAVRRISNGNITIFDNGNYHNPQFSRVIEYSLDEVNKTATLVWEYRRSPSVYSAFMGYAQRLDNGNTLIGWGGTNPTVTEVTPSGIRVFEMTFPVHTYSYRAYKFDWNNNPLSMNNEENGIPAEFKLHPNYPNPFNPVTLITFDIPGETYAELAVFDITGKEIQKLESGYFKPGSYTASFNGSMYSSGLYFCRLRAGVFSASHKMILVK